MELIEKRLPRIAKIATTRTFRILLLLIAVGLLAAMWEERRQASTVAGERAVSTGNASASGTSVVANTGNSATINNGTSAPKDK